MGTVEKRSGGEGEQAETAAGTDQPGGVVKENKGRSKPRLPKDEAGFPVAQRRRRSGLANLAT